MHFTGDEHCVGISSGGSEEHTKVSAEDSQEAMYETIPLLTQSQGWREAMQPAQSASLQTQRCCLGPLCTWSHRWTAPEEHCSSPYMPRSALCTPPA